MFVRIGNTPRDYAWGSTTAIADLLGRVPSGRPEAELWFGAHPASPSEILDPARAAGRTDLAAWAALDPAVRPPFLLKVLAAASPLSLQAHPSPEQARLGYQRENEQGIALESAERNYKDDSAKPEMIYALSERFDALCGFRPPAETAGFLQRLSEYSSGVHARALTQLRSRLTASGIARTVAGSDAGSVSAELRSVVAWLLGGDPEIARVVTAVVDSARTASVGRGLVRELDRDSGPEAGQDIRPESGREIDDGIDRDLETVLILDSAFPGDPGIVLALMLNRVTLRRGEALYLPAGNIHAYLFGLGIELMTASDNVLRGGLTNKHIDVDELLNILLFEPLAAPRLTPSHPAQGVDVFHPDLPDFALTHVSLDVSSGPVEVPLPSVAIALCTDGEALLVGSRDRQRLVRGEAAYISADESRLTISGSGTVFVATTNA